MFDPVNIVVKVKLHWDPYDVPNCQVRRELERFGKVSEISRDYFCEKGFEHHNCPDGTRGWNRRRRHPA